MSLRYASVPRVTRQLFWGLWFGFLRCPERFRDAAGRRRIGLGRFGLVEICLSLLNFMRDIDILYLMVGKRKRYGDSFLELGGCFFSRGK